MGFSPRGAFKPRLLVAAPLLCGKNWITDLRKEHIARTPIHPGEHLREELETLRMSAAELSRQLGVQTTRVTGILNGQRSITGDTALRLAHFFGTSPEFWLNLQSLY